MVDEELRDLARAEMKKVIKSLAAAANNPDKPNHYCARLLAEMAGFARPTTGRPPNKRNVDLMPAKTQEEADAEGEFYDEILVKHNNGEV